jgi:DNA-binding NarL/FixJ family response regulator
MNIAIIANNLFYRESLKIALNQITDFNISFDSDNLNSLFQIAGIYDFQVVLIDSIYYQSENIKKIFQCLPYTKILILSDSIESYFLDQQLDGISFDFIPKSSTKSLFEIKIRDSFNPSIIFNM